MRAPVTGMNNCAPEVGKVLPWGADCPEVFLFLFFCFCCLQVETFQREENVQWHRGTRDQGMLPECDLGPRGPGGNRKWTWGCRQGLYPKAIVEERQHQRIWWKKPCQSEGSHSQQRRLGVHGGEWLGKIQSCTLFMNQDKPNVVAHTRSPRTGEAEARGS